MMRENQNNNIQGKKRVAENRKIFCENTKTNIDTIIKLSNDQQLVEI